MTNMAAMSVVPSYEWTRVGPGVMVPEGTQVRTAADGSGFRLVRIPPTWQLRVTTAPENEACNVGVTRRTTLAAIRAAVASVLVGGDVRQVKSLRINGDVVAKGCGCGSIDCWAQTVEQLQLFGQRVVCIIGSTSTLPKMRAPKQASTDVMPATTTSYTDEGISCSTPKAHPPIDEPRSPADSCDEIPNKTLAPVVRRRRTSWLSRKLTALAKKDEQLHGGSFDGKNAERLKSKTNEIASMALSPRRRRSSWLSRHLVPFKTDTRSHHEALLLASSGSNAGYDAISPVSALSEVNNGQQKRRDDGHIVRRRRSSWLPRHLEAARQQQQEATCAPGDKRRATKRRCLDKLTSLRS
eukprot:TRINITY_DN43951_c0_g1_i1.p1 TRINITY_DN43951_c0_g1~~TRINITY_DN43951_c0_g1_i1.p1  ORF type:complete len:354 (+),score=41.00 TRINITY_DN43951_c0_g1_i1:28-1089(+)